MKEALEGSKSIHNHKKVPTVVRISFNLWMIAIGAGVFETVLAIVRYATGNMEDATGTGVFIQVAIRLIIFAVMTLIIVQMRNGKNWARIALAVLLGGLGTLSLVIGPIEWLFQGHSLNQVFDGVNGYDLLFAASRMVHVACVITGMIYMFLSSANRYFR